MNPESFSVTLSVMELWLPPDNRSVLLRGYNGYGIPSVGQKTGAN